MIRNRGTIILVAATTLTALGAADEDSMPKKLPDKAKRSWARPTISNCCRSTRIRIKGRRTAKLTEALGAAYEASRQAP